MEHRLSSAVCVVEDYVHSGALRGVVLPPEEVAAAAFAWAQQELQAAGSAEQPAQPQYLDAYKMLLHCTGKAVAGGVGGAAGAAAVAAYATDPLLRQVLAPGGCGRGGITVGFTAVGTPASMDERWKVEQAAASPLWQTRNWVLTGMEGGRIVVGDELPQLVGARTQRTLADLGSQLTVPAPTWNDVYDGLIACLSASAPPEGGPPAARLVVALGNRGIKAYFKGYVLWGSGVTEQDISRWRMERGACAQAEQVREYVASLQPGTFVSPGQAATAAQQLTAQRLAAAGSQVVPAEVQQRAAQRVLEQAAGLADADADDEEGAPAGLALAMAAAVAELPPVPPVQLRRLVLAGKQQGTFYTHNATSDAELVSFYDQKQAEAAALRETRRPTAEQVRERQVFGSGRATLAVDIFESQATTAIVSHEHSDHTHLLSVKKGLKHAGLDSTEPSTSLLLGGDLERLFQTITSIDAPETLHKPSAGDGVHPDRVSGIVKVPHLQVRDIGEGRTIALFDTWHSMASSGVVCSFQSGDTILTTGDGCFDEPEAVQDAVAAVLMLQTHLQERGVEMRLSRVVVDDTRASKSVALSSVAQPTRQESLAALLVNVRRLLSEHKFDAAVMLGFRSSGRSAAAEELAHSCNLGPVFLCPTIHKFERAFRGLEGMAAFTQDPADAFLHLLTVGGEGVPRKYADRPTWLREYAERVLPDLGRPPRILLVDSAGWGRPGDGVTFFMGGATRASFADSGGVLVLGATLSDHSTLAGVCSLLCALHDECGLQQEAVLPLTSSSDDASHLCDWEEEE